MTSIINFTVISGAYSEDPLCYLLEIDEFKFLLDCGWNEKFDVADLKQLEQYCPQVDAVLISHPDLLHFGGLPYAVSKFGLSCPIYATDPVSELGVLFLYDAIGARENQEDFKVISFDDVDKVRDNCVSVKYSQVTPMDDPGITVTAYPAGHFVGGTVWKIKKDTEEFVYAVDYNHRRERVLVGTPLDTFSRPTLLITNSFNFTRTQPKRKDLDRQLMSKIISTLRGDGCVLLATDTAGRALELVQQLDTTWASPDAGLSVYPIFLLNMCAPSVIADTQKYVEFLSDRLFKQREDPFALRHVRLAGCVDDVLEVPGPKVVLTSLDSMVAGFTLDLFMRWAPSPKNCIIFTNRPVPGTLGRELCDNPDLRRVEVAHKVRITLEGEELVDYLKHEGERKAAEAHAKAADTLESDEEEEQVDVLKRHDIMADTEAPAQQIFRKQTKTFPMFSIVEDKALVDDYGEAIRHEDFMITDGVIVTSSLVAPVQEVVPDVTRMEESVDSEVKPAKFQETTVAVGVECSVSYLDFEGRSDKEGMVNILYNVKPRQLIVIHGSTADTESFVAHCNNTSDGIIERVFAPHVGDVVNVTLESHIYKARLKDSLVSALQFSHVQDHELAWIDGMITLGPTPGSVPVIDAAPNKRMFGHHTVFVGDLRLSEFKQVLSRSGIQAVFVGGLLVCDDCVAVRRDATGAVLVEGPVCDTYYSVRTLLYQQFAIV